MSDTLKNWENDNKKVLTPPNTAWPTVLLFFVALLSFIGMTYGALFHIIPLWIALIINGIAQYAMFTVLHDASHRSLSQISWFNDTLGTIAAFILSPIAGIRVFRFVHMQHHRFTNEGGKVDPDEWCGKGKTWTLPLRWMTLDIHYVFWYAHYWFKRPRKERMELVISLFITIAVFAIAAHFDLALRFALLWLLPARFAVTWLALAFDFIPHYPHDTKASDNEFRATTMHPTHTWLMTPIMLAQNAHLIHHLYPRVPFYRYLWVWHHAKKELMECGARLMRWNGTEIKVDN